ncbi:MAG: hypothetical protein F4Z73_03840 [Synechococcus sp. SB0668_bin_13]|nr:hypothetical protein [Synechococcus sp. SB0668_bin_13]MYG64576.1 hypothetical protein [Synechococcus sp. SB0675_bin_7]MYK85379.1 hypothetical protein [Synechococcus sp. SB0669_bin_7]
MRCRCFLEELARYPVPTSGWATTAGDARATAPDASSARSLPRLGAVPLLLLWGRDSQPGLPPQHHGLVLGLPPSAHQAQGPACRLQVTAGNTDGRQPPEALTAALHGKVFTDKGTLSKSLLARLWQRDHHLITGGGRNTKNYLLPLLDTVLLGKRFIIETTLFEVLKSSMVLEHTRHRSPARPWSIFSLAWRQPPWHNPRATSATSPSPTPCTPSQPHSDLIQNSGLLSRLL